MRYMIMVKEGENANEINQMPSDEMIAAMGRLNKEMIEAGVLLVAEGLVPSKFGRKVRFEGKAKHVSDGPFSETKELIGGFWIIRVNSKEELMAWIDKIPLEAGEIEIRRVAEAEDFTRNETTAEALDTERDFRERTQKPITS